MDTSQPIPDVVPARQLPAAVRSARRLARTSTSTSRSAPSSRCCAARTASPRPQDEHFLQPGTAQVAAGYCTYGPSTMLVLTVGNGTHAFTLDREVGSFVLTTRGMQIPEETKEFAVNMSNQRFWEAPMQRYVGELLGRQGRPARQGLQHALGRLDGRRRAPHPHPRRHLHLSARQQVRRARAASCA